eukprot:5145238-Pleurochrysis_carterae.AAC.1
MFTPGFDYQILLSFCNPAVALLVGGRAIEVCRAADFVLDSILVEAVHLPAQHRVDVSDDVGPFAVERMRFTRVVPSVSIVLGDITGGEARWEDDIAIASKAVVAPLREQVPDLVVSRG